MIAPSPWGSFYMQRKYRFRFPIQVIIFKFGITIAWHAPIVRKRTESISIFLGMFDEE
jgi:hypothetical protein